MLDLPCFKKKSDGEGGMMEECNEENYPTASDIFRMFGDDNNQIQEATFACQNETVPINEAQKFCDIYASSFRTITDHKQITEDPSSMILLNYNGHVPIKTEEENDDFKCSFSNYTKKHKAVENVEAMTVSDRISCFSSLNNHNFMNPYLIEPDLKHIDKDGDTPLHIFVAQCSDEYQHGKAAELLSMAYFYQPYVNVQNKLGQTPLHLAVEIGSIDLIRVLLQFGAYIHVYDHRLDSPFHTVLHPKSTNCGNHEDLKEIVETLLTPTDQAKLFDLHSKINAKNQKGLSAIHLATKKRDFGLISLLHKNGANINDQEGKSGMTPLMMLIDEAKNKQMEQQKELLILAKSLVTQLSADVNVRSYSGDSPLHLACACDCLELVNVLLDNGADVNEKNVYRKTEKDLTSSKEIKNLLEVHYRKKRRKRKIQNDNDQPSKIAITDFDDDDC